MVRIVGAEDAADVMQQVFLQVFRKIDQFSGRSQLSTWLYRVAVNEALQHLRTRDRAVTRTLEFDVVDRSPASTQRSEDAEILEQALARLDPELRCVFLLREGEGMDYHDIASALNIVEGTVASRLNRARRQLRDHLVELGWQP
jgi:RNA polymerase sigma-70 factor (ECF subfamily)